MWYIHITDEFTRYIAASIIISKIMSTKALIKNCIAICGGPRKIFIDNGEEFIGDTLHEITKI